MRKRPLSLLIMILLLGGLLTVTKTAATKAKPSRTACIVPITQCLMALALVAGWLVGRRFSGCRYPKVAARSLRRQDIAATYSRLAPVCVPLMICMALVLVLPQRVQAAVFNCVSGNVTCLIDAINAANSNGVADTITLDGSTFTLNAVDNTPDEGPNGLPLITSEITIEGNGSIIRRDANATAQFRIFEIAVGGQLALNNVTVSNGLLPPNNGALTRGYEGGGILNIGTLTITNSTISNNKAADDSTTDGIGGLGGGISNRAFAFIRRSTIRDNRAGDSSGENGDGGCGGGIFSSDTIIPPATIIESSLEITNSTISNNRSGDGDLTAGRGGIGAGICMFGSELNIIASTLNDNTAGKGFAGGDGGGIFVASSAVVNITNSTFYQNAAGGFLKDGTLFGGYGGAIDVGELNATVNITNCTIVANRAGIVFPGVSVVNGKGGAIAVNPRLTERNTVNVKNTIISSNFFVNFFGDILFQDCFNGPNTDIVDQGYNIDELTSCGFSAANHSQSNSDPQLVTPGSLGNNGGPTQTMALCTGAGTPHPACPGISPAVDAIPNGTNGCGSPPLDKDQRGVSRPLDGDGDAIAACDIGAYEAPRPNYPPVCTAAVASPAVLGLANHAFVPVQIMGVSDPDADPVTLTVTAVTQDEAPEGLWDGDLSPDAVPQAGQLWLRAERASGGNGRVYRVSFTAADGHGGACLGHVTVCVPSERLSATCVDDGQHFNALHRCSRRRNERCG